jgi:hypothetical protein
MSSHGRCRDRASSSAAQRAALDSADQARKWTANIIMVTSVSAPMTGLSIAMDLTGTTVRDGQCGIADR